MRGSVRWLLLLLAGAVGWCGLPATAAHAVTTSLNVTLSVPNTFVDNHTVESATVTVTDQNGVVVAGAQVQQASGGCAWWDQTPTDASGIATVGVTIDCAATVQVSVTDPASGVTGTSNSVSVDVRRLANPTLTLTDQPPYGFNDPVHGTVRAVDQRGNPFVKAYVAGSGDGCASWPQANADSTGLINVSITFTCSDAVALPVVALSDDGNVTDDSQQTPPVQVTPSATPAPTLQLPPGPYHYKQVVTGTIKMVTGGGHPLAGATLDSNTDLGACVQWPSATSGADGIITVQITVTCNADTTMLVHAPDGTTLQTPSTHFACYAPISLSAPTTTVKRPYYTVTLAPQVPAPVRQSARHLYIQTSQDGHTWSSTDNLAGTAATPADVWFAHPGAAYARLFYAGDVSYVDTISNAVSLTVQSGTPPAWLTQFNRYRAVAGLPSVGEDPQLDAADNAHVRYMAKTHQFGHTENPSSRYYSALGNYGGVSSELYAGIVPSRAVAGWLATPYHQVGMLEPSLYTTGFATYGGYTALFVYGESQVVPRATAVTTWARSGGTQPLHVFPGNETPDPLTHCPSSYRRAAAKTGLGAALLAMMPAPSKSTTPTASLYDNGRRVSACVFGDGPYYAPDDTAQYLVHVLPLAPERARHHYKVVVREAGRTVTWTFTA